MTETTTRLESDVQTLHEMILSGQILEAFDRFYAHDVIMQDNLDEPRKGKADNRRYEEQFVGGITEFRGAEVKAVTIDADTGIVMTEWFMDYSHTAFGDVQLAQVSVQRWRDGQIVHERFYHNAY